MKNENNQLRQKVYDGQEREQLLKQKLSDAEDQIKKLNKKENMVTDNKVAVSVLILNTVNSYRKRQLNFPPPSKIFGFIRP